MYLTAMNDPKEVKEHIAKLVDYYQQERSDPKMTDKELAQRAGVALATVLHIKDTTFEYLPRLSQSSRLRTPWEYRTPTLYLERRHAMKLENILNLAAVAVIAAHLGKKAQEKKDIQALDEVLNQFMEELKAEERKGFL